MRQRKPPLTLADLLCYEEEVIGPGQVRLTVYDGVFFGRTAHLDLPEGARLVRADLVIPQPGGIIDQNPRAAVWQGRLRIVKGTATVIEAERVSKP